MKKEQKKDTFRWLPAQVKIRLGGESEIHNKSEWVNSGGMEKIEIKIDLYKHLYKERGGWFDSVYK